ncbi:hypothetical protein Aph01nite_46380 [Acrocarpospora phusangensis]|uniref:Tn3 transposase DDE domain-containing protein n=1 Tax=Acrocarpospora phusangensis TaxID=1070424 RepID=A0A919UQE3_9ACTN|nr:hypothetical protein Aph01nite_46380 [Acrocarpospora phusangensis]
MPGVETGTYGALEDLARIRVNLNTVITHWPDMLRVAGSLVTNQVRAYDLLRMFGREGRSTPWGAAFAEYGRIAKTEHLLRVVDPVDDTYRRQMNRQLTVQESRHKLARDVCHGKRGTITRRTTTAWRTSSTRSVGSSTPSCSGRPATSTPPSPSSRPRPRDPRGGHCPAFPAQARNLNLLGRYGFTASVPAAGALRPLRDPDAPGLDEDDEAEERARCSAFTGRPQRRERRRS